jgi:flagellar basal-body rod modification protein FlgD
MSSQIPPISSLLTPPNPADQIPGTQSSSSSNDTLGANAFLQLLTTEMENQDPTSPQDPTESVTQLAQFSELQYQQQLTSAFQSFQSNFSVLQASSLIGKEATMETSSSSGSSSTVTGTISSIDVENGEPYVTMIGSNGQTISNSNGTPLLFSLSQIVGIGTSSSSGSNPGSGSSNPGSGSNPGSSNGTAPSTGSTSPNPSSGS